MHTLSSPTEVQEFRDNHLAPGDLLGRLEPGGRYLLNVPPGIGKTTVAVNMVNHPDRRKHFRKVAFVVGRHDLITDIRPQIRSDLNVEVYPPLTSALCDPAPDSPLQSYIRRGMTKLAEADICRPCQLRDNCPFARRLKKTVFENAIVVFITDALLRVRPSVLTDWGFGLDTLVIFDEVRGADEGFVHTFTTLDLNAEIEAARAAGLALLASVLTQVRDEPLTPFNPVGVQTELLYRAVPFQGAGAKILGFRNIALYACTYAQRPLWFEDGVYAVSLQPNITSTTLFLGGYLTRDFVASRYG